MGAVIVVYATYESRGPIIFYTGTLSDDLGACLGQKSGRRFVELKRLRHWQHR